MRGLLWFALGGFAGLFVMAVICMRFLADRQEDEWARIAAALQAERAGDAARIAGALRAERAARCERGQHREVLATTTPHMYLWCQDCRWREEIGIAYPTGTNRKSRPAA